jgi:diacylglycerol kinase (ATP)
MGADLRETPPSKVGVVAHTGKTLGGGLLDLRRELARQGVEDPFWREVPKSKAARAEVKRALDAGIDMLFVWGGDGIVQRCIDVIAGSDVALAIIPAGTANLLATNLGIPANIEQAVAIGLHGDRRKLDVGRFNGERFGVMAGAGFDASMIQQADGTLKDRLGRVAYVWSGSKSLRAKPFKAKIAIDDTLWYSGSASCILVGNVGRLFGGIEVFEDARPDDGRLEIGVVNADGVTDWVRTLARTALGHADKSPLVRATSAKKIKVKLDRKVLYEVDGGDRVKVKSFKIKVEPTAVTVCVPAKPHLDAGRQEGRSA